MRYTVQVNGQSFDVELTARDASSLTFVIDGISYTTAISPSLDRAATTAGSAPHSSRSFDGTVSAPMPGIIVSIPVSVGQQISAGSNLLIIEAMKMENNVPAPVAGTVTEVLVTEGQEIDSNQPLIRIDTAI